MKNEVKDKGRSKSIASSNLIGLTFKEEQASKRDKQKKKVEQRVQNANDPRLARGREIIFIVRSIDSVSPCKMTEIKCKMLPLASSASSF